MENKDITILLHPYNNDTNLYINNLKNYLYGYSEKIRIVGNDFKKDLIKEKYDIVYLNWLEGYVAQSNKVKSYTYFYLIKCALLYWKKSKKKIIWTYHNKFPHECKDMKLAKKIMDIMFKYADIVIVHSKDSKKYCESIHGINSKILYYPHPNYNDNYKKVTNKLDNKKINIGFFGAIKPYKGIENIIHIFKSIDNDNIELSIIGKPYTEEYKKELISLCKDDSRIKLDLRFINDDEIPKLFSGVDILLLSYSGESFLISGSSILSFSLATPIIAPKIGMFNDYEESEFVYLYENDNNESIKNIIEEISNLDKKLINNIGEQAYKYSTSLSWSTFIESIFEKLI